MKESMRLRIVAFLGIMAAASAAGAVEFGFDTDATNVNIPWSKTSPLTVDKLPRNYYFWGGEAWMKAPLGEDASIRVAYDRDIVLRNTLSATAEFERGIAKISAGPVIGFLNSDSCPFSAGMSASARLQWPGIAYVSVRSDGGTALFSFQDKAEPQASTELAAGFYVPYAIVSGVLSVKRFSELVDDELVTDSLTRYAMTIEVFKKNVPYTATLSMGYDRRAKTYDAYDATDALGSIFIGVDAAATMKEGFVLKAGFTSSAYVFGLDELRGRGPGSSAYMFAMNFGVAFDVGKLRGAPKDKAGPAAEAAGLGAEEAKAENPQAVPGTQPQSEASDAAAETAASAPPVSEPAQ